MNRLRWSVHEISRLLLVVITLVGCETVPLREPDDSTGELGKVQQDRPSDVYVGLGVAYLQKGQYAVALRKLKQGLAADPKDARVYNVMGFLYERLGELGLADKNYRTAIELEPENPFFRNAWGSFLCHQQQFPKAQQQFEFAVNNPLYPTPWVAMTNAGLCAKRAGKPELAERNFRKALTANDTFPIALFQMAKLNFEQERYLPARAYLQRYLAAEEHTAQSLWLGIRIENQLGGNDLMANYKSMLRQDFPDAPEIQMLREYEQR